MKRAIVCLVLAISVTGARAASDLDQINALAQSQFRLLAEDLGAALSYKPLIPAEPLGLTGFDIGIEITGTKLENEAIFETATSDSVPAVLPVPKIHAHKGLPAGFDIGIVYSQAPDSNIEFWGGEVRYAILKGGVAMPAVGVRASRTSLRGVDQLELETTGLDVSISKGFAMLTPYVGAGRVWTDATPQNIAALQEENFGMSKVFGGLNINLALLNIAIEADTTGDALSYGAKLGLRF